MKFYEVLLSEINIKSSFKFSAYSIEPYNRTSGNPPYPLILRYERNDPRYFPEGELMSILLTFAFNRRIAQCYSHRNKAETPRDYPADGKCYVPPRCYERLTFL